MVTVIVGRPNDSAVCRIVSMSDVVGSAKKVEFDISNKANLQKGEPKWANYVKGVIVNFPCNFFNLPVFTEICNIS